MYCFLLFWPFLFFILSNFYLDFRSAFEQTTLLPNQRGHVTKILMLNRPEHIAIIMDGNGRWAVQKGFHRIKGHHQGAKTAKQTILAASRFGIRELTLFGFSKDNWQRPQEEVEGLLTLLGQTLEQSREELLQEQVRIQVIGDQSRFPQELQKILHDLCIDSDHHNGLRLTLAISYGSRSDIAKAIQNVITQVQAGQLKMADIGEQTLRSFLSTKSSKDPDFVIRTGGEKRLSDFLLFESAYAELYFTDILWPDFTEEDFQKALDEFASRNRRFGKI